MAQTAPNNLAGPTTLSPDTAYQTKPNIRKGIHWPKTAASSNTDGTARRQHAGTQSGLVVTPETE